MHWKKLWVDTSLEENQCGYQYVIYKSLTWFDFHK